MKKIALILGGTGAEAEVSRVTGKAFEAALKDLGYQYIVVEADNQLPVVLQKEKPDVALLGVHGKYGEDGTLQGVCEYLKIPYSGSGVLASALCMDKAFCKMLFDKNAIPTAKYQVLNLKESPFEKFNLELSFPLVVKPSREGSSVGVSIVKSESDFAAAINLAAIYDYRIVIEKFIEGKEVTVPLMGDKVLPCVEIAPKVGFYDYKNKYTAGNTNYIIPANIEKKTLNLISDLAVKSCALFRSRSYARVDFMLDKNETPYVMEVNTLPGCTPTSLVPKSAAAMGIEFKDFINYLIETATLDYAGLK